MGTHNCEDTTAAWFIKAEFMQRMPPQAQDILAAFCSQLLEELTKITDFIIINKQHLILFSGYGTGTDF